MLNFKNLAAVVPLLALVNAATYTVTIGIVETDGQPGIGFDPTSIRPAAGDTITFTFALPAYVKNPVSAQHSATQSTFDNPCTPWEGGFDTGIQSTGSVNANTGASFVLAVNDTNPLWFFSSANTDCKSGMVLSVNPPLSGDQTAAAFVDKAKASSGSSSQPPAESPQSSSINSATNTPSSLTSSGSPPSQTASPNAVAALNQRKGLILACFAAAVLGLAVTA